MNSQSFVRLFERPDYFLDRFDAENREFVFRPATKSLITSSPFLDERWRLPGSTDVYRAPLSQALDWMESVRNDRPNRLILHTSFCGSTLLANLLAGIGPSLPYREPDLLARLASLKAEKHTVSADPALWDGIVRFTLSQFRKSWDGRPAFVKASNWANPIIPDLQAADPDLRIQVITMDLEDYLIANLRGGRARLGWSLDFLNHLLACGKADRSRVLEVERAGLRPLQRLLRLLCVVHDAQTCQMRSAQQSSDWLTLPELRSSPISALGKASRQLGLPLDTSRVRETLSVELARHAKQPTKAFDPHAEAAENARLYGEFADELSEALQWRSERVRATG